MMLEKILQDLGIDGDPFADEVREIWNGLPKRSQDEYSGFIEKNKGKSQVARAMIFAASLTAADLIAGGLIRGRR